MSDICLCWAAMPFAYEAWQYLAAKAIPAEWADRPDLVPCVERRIKVQCNDQWQTATETDWIVRYPDDQFRVHPHYQFQVIFTRETPQFGAKVRAMGNSIQLRWLPGLDPAGNGG